MSRHPFLRSRAKQSSLAFINHTRHPLYYMDINTSWDANCQNFKPAMPDSVFNILNVRAMMCISYAPGTSVNFKVELFAL